MAALSAADRARGVAAYRAAIHAGVPPADAVAFLRISWRESRWNPRAYNGNSSTGDRSYGLMQINMLGNLGPSRRAAFGISRDEELFDPVINMRAAWILEQQTRKAGKRPYHAWGWYKAMDPMTGALDAATANSIVQEAGGSPVAIASSTGTRPKLDPTKDVGPGPWTPNYLLYELEVAGVSDPAEQTDALSIALAVAGVPPADPNRLMMAAGSEGGPSGYGWFSLTAEQANSVGATATLLRSPRGATEAAVKVARAAGGWQAAFPNVQRQANYGMARKNAQAFVNNWKKDRASYPDFNPWDQGTYDVGGVVEIKDPASMAWDAVQKGIQGIFAGIDAIARFIAVLLNPELWVRIGMVLGGAVLALAAGVLLFRNLVWQPEGSN